jgi:hypothetical protein
MMLCLNIYSVEKEAAVKLRLKKLKVIKKNIFFEMIV